MRIRRKEKEVPVRNNAGIYKRFWFDEAIHVWKETGKYRALRRVVRDGVSRKEQAMFDNLEDAKSFRMGVIEKPVSKGNNFHLIQVEDQNEGITFKTVIEKWKQFHFLKLEEGSKQHYEIRLPHLEFLHTRVVEKISTAAIDELVAHWVQNYPKTGKRHTFEKELDLLKVILNFYRKRINPSFPIPILPEHYEAADIAKKAVKAVQSLTEEELGKFLADLKGRPNPVFYSIALTQFCLGLRACEVCGLSWDSLNLEQGIARIEQTVTWDHDTWEAKIKPRPKNGKQRILVIPQVLVQELKQIKAKRDPSVSLVFHKQGQPMNRQALGKAYNRALARLGLPHLSGTHIMRKTSATLANEITGDFYAVSKLLDHSSPDITLRYVAQTTTQKKKVADALNAVLVNHQGGRG